MKTHALFAAVLLAGYALGLPLDAAMLTLTRGPYLQLGTQSSIVLRWRTETATDSRVRYGTNPSDLSSVVDDSTSTTEHVVMLTGLNPSTKYYYSVGHSEATLAGGTDHFFVAAPPPGTEQPTNIWVLGSSGIANAKARAVRDAYLKYKGNQYTHLWLMLGDNAHQNGTESDYQEALFNTYPTLLPQTTLWPALSHRDDGATAASASQSGAYYDIFTLPKQGEAGGLASGTDAYYSFDYSNIHFVVLDSMESSKAPSGAMLTWLENDLAVTTQPWIIAYWDHPPCSKGLHDSDTEIALREMRENVLPILENASVDLVLNGDCGSYERSFPIDGHSRSSVAFEPKTVDGGDGSINGDGEYQTSVIDRPIRDAVVGSSGETQVGSLDYPVIYVSLKTLGSMALNVNGPLLDAVFLDDTGQVRDRFRMVKTTDTAKASTSASDVPTTAVNPTPQTVTVSPAGGTVGRASAPAATVTINVGDNWQTVINANPAGTTYNIAPGVHRFHRVTPKAGDTFVGQPGAIMSGSKVLTSFTQSGATWFASGQTQESTVQSGFCLAAFPRCFMTNDVFINNVPSKHVTSIGAVVPGTFFFDYAADRIYIGDNPAGKTVETSVTKVAFEGAATGVTIDNLIFEKYGNPAQIGTLHGDAASNWVVRNSEIRLNHGTGIRMGPGFILQDNKINNNGQLGIGCGGCPNGQVLNNEIASNNFAGFSPGWEAGGTKWARTNTLLIQGNFSHHNIGPGLWTDIDNINVTYDGNRVEDNTGTAGIFHEISCNATIKNNIVKRNAATDPTGWLYGPQILISTSHNVKVFNNYVEATGTANGITALQQNRGSGPNCGTWSTHDNSIYDNSVYYSAAGNVGFSGASGDFNLPGMTNISFNNNAYCADSLSNTHWAWTTAFRNWAGFQGQGQEANGSAYTLSNSLCTQMKNEKGLPGKRPLTSDTTPPAVSLTAPANAATVSGSSVTVSANASDNVGIRSVVFKVGATLSTDTTSPYSMIWNTTTATNGSHTLTATASDAAGNTKTSSSVTVTVNNTAPSTQSPYGGTPRTIPGTIQGEDYDNGGEGIAYHDTDTLNNGGTYRTDGVDIKNSSDSPASPAIGWVNVGEWWEYTVNVPTAGTYNLEARVASAYDGKSFHIEIDGVDKTGPMAVPNTGPWGTGWATVTKTGVSLTAGSHVMRIFANTDLFDLSFVKLVPPADITPPSVFLSAPASGSTVSGTATTVSANASDNVGVTSVVFKVEGITLSTDTTSPYSMSWNTTTATNGSHTLTATASDAAGNTTTSSSVTVTVNNTAPSTQSPYGGTPRTIPGTIQAEDYDNGGEGIAYHDTDTINIGGTYRTNGVDIKNSSDSPASPAIGWVNVGEWWEYTVNVPTAGTYNLEARVASAYDGKSFHIEIDGVDKTGPMAVPNTGPWGTGWATVTKTGVSLTAGSHVMRIFANTDLFDLSFVKLVPR